MSKQFEGLGEHVVKIGDNMFRRIITPENMAGLNQEHMIAAVKDGRVLIYTVKFLEQPNRMPRTLTFYRHKTGKWQLNAAEPEALELLREGVLEQACGIANDMAETRFIPIPGDPNHE